VGGSLVTDGGRIIKKTKLTSANSPYTVLLTDYYLVANVTSGDVQLNFPDGIDSRLYIVKVVGNTNECILHPHLSDKMFENVVGDNEILHPGEEEIMVFDSTENSWV
jgi:hypothetical protein